MNNDDKSIVSANEIWGEQEIASRLRAFVRLRDYFIPDKLILRTLRDIIISDRSSNAEKLKAIAHAVDLYPELKALTPPQQLVMSGYIRSEQVRTLEIPQEWLNNWEQRVIDAEVEEIEEVVTSSTKKISSGGGKS